MNIKEAKKRFLSRRRSKFFTKKWLNKTNIPKVMISFYEESDPSNCRSAWANYNDDGNLINITNFHGTILTILNDGNISVENQIWIPKTPISINMY